MAYYFCHCVLKYLQQADLLFYSPFYLLLINNVSKHSVSLSWGSGHTYCVLKDLVLHICTVLACVGSSFSIYRNFLRKGLLESLTYNTHTSWKWPFGGKSDITSHLYLHCAFFATAWQHSTLLSPDLRQRGQKRPYTLDIMQTLIEVQVDRYCYCPQVLNCMPR